jgi:hypothetical protein
MRCGKQDIHAWRSLHTPASSKSIDRISPWSQHLSFSFAFLFLAASFAPNFHAAMKNIAPVWREMEAFVSYNQWFK